VEMHDFAITEHYTLFMDLPLTFAWNGCNGRATLLFCQIVALVSFPGTKITVISAGSGTCYIFHPECL